ncbi:hypothetical protein [Streptomyces atratus]|uniref:hypothetical protein n=1 Tax=Streptomyces atratus TaxID=1893 RepID=UPI00324E8741
MNSKGRTKLPPTLMAAVRAKKMTASHAVLWAAVEHCCALGRKQADGGQATLGDAIGASRKKAARLLVDASPLFANLDGRGPLMVQEQQEKGLPTIYRSRRRTNGRIGAWAPTWTLCLVCDGARHENLLSARLVSPEAWVLFALLVWWAGDDGACRRTVLELADAMGCSPREAQRLTRELRSAGLLLVRDRRVRDGGVTAKSSVLIPVVERSKRYSAAERTVVALLQRLPADLPAELAWSLDLLEPAGDPGPGRVSFGGWAAWRALVAMGPVMVLPAVLAERFAVPEEDAARWSEEAALAGLATLSIEGIWTPVLSPSGAPPDPVLEAMEGDSAGDAEADGMTSSLTQPMTSSLTQPMTSSLTQPMTSSLTHETSTLSRDPVHSARLMPSEEVDVVEGEGDVVLPPPKADVVGGCARERPTAGAARRSPLPHQADVQRVTAAPEVQALLWEPMTAGQRAKAAQLIGEALTNSETRSTPDQLAYRLTQSLTGKGSSDIENPFAWLRSRLLRRGCAKDCTCWHPACEEGILWPQMASCSHCERESVDRLADWRREHPERVPASDDVGNLEELDTARPQIAQEPRLRIVPEQPPAVPEAFRWQQQLEPAVRGLDEFTAARARMRKARTTA